MNPKKKPTQSINDLDLSRWKEYGDIITDSLWLFPKRDDSGVHSPEYWGNFIPQIVTQAVLRFTKKGETVLDGFLGLGTTLIECRRLGRNGVGVELVPWVASRANWFVNLEPNDAGVTARVIEGDSRLAETGDKVRLALKECGTEQAHLLVLHPPYHDIIRFSDLEGDLSGAASEADFYDMFERVVANYSPFLAPDRYLVLVIGDKYAGGEWLPLGFRSMERVYKYGYTLKSICVKDIQENRGKRNKLSLWRYRALKGGYYIFKHEYIIFFKKDGRI
ncbi:MAG: DNA methyltransferase [Chloroflexota bacterium]